MFIAAGSDFSGGKVMVGHGEKRVAETQTAARMGGGLRVIEELQGSYRHEFVTKPALPQDTCHWAWN